MKWEKGILKIFSRYHFYKSLWNTKLIKKIMITNLWSHLLDDDDNIFYEIKKACSITSGKEVRYQSSENPVSFKFPWSQMKLYLWTCQLLTTVWVGNIIKQIYSIHFRKASWKRFWTWKRVPLDLKKYLFIFLFIYFSQFNFSYLIYIFYNSFKYMSILYFDFITKSYNVC